MNINDVRPVFVFGISGATWTILNPMIERGALPTFARLKNQGVSGPLTSVKTPGDKHYRPQVAFPSLATGCLPEHHGITEFYHTADNLRVPALWHVFNQHNLQVGLYGWPMTWPPKDIDGFVIPCHHGRDAQTLPAHLSPIKQLDRQQQNLERSGSKSSRWSPMVSLVKLMSKHIPPVWSLLPLAKTALALLGTNDIEQRSMLLRRAKFYLSCGLSMALYRQHRPGLMMFNTFYIDLIEHRFWRYHEPQSFIDLPDKPAFRDAVEQSYQQTDKMLGKMLKQLPANAIVAVVAEHGMAVEKNSAEVGERRYAIRGDAVKALLNLPKQMMVIPIARWIAFRLPDCADLDKNLTTSLSAITVVQTGLPLFNVHLNGKSEVIIKFNFND
ncbi:MAG: alkaline phosphatase family protein, partial [Psychrosphaera sp.]|nr:alkaline phosphatase family protein [Psychrosphaera sp.]